MPIKTFRTDSLSGRIWLTGIGLLCLTGVFFTAKWFFGNAIASRALQKEVADFAVSMAPADPETHSVAGSLYEGSFQPADLPKSLAEYEKAVALSPYDYRYWVAFGKAKERNGDPAGAEKALRRALELAPNYAGVQWVYGNILLRQGKNAEAFAAIRRAVAGDEKYAGPAAAAAWDIFAGDLEDIQKNVGDSAPVRASLAAFLAGQKRFDEALPIWDKLPADKKRTVFRPDGERIFNQLIENKRYRAALRIRSQIDEKEAAKAAAGQITDGGFETVSNTDQARIFEWQIAVGDKPLIGVSEEQKHGGQKSLALVFNSPVGRDFRNVAQTVAVEGGKEYEFQIYYRSELETSAALKWEIVDAFSGSILATTAAIEKNTDWKSLTAAFKTESEGVIIRLAREQCTSADCSITGTVWFDDAFLK